MTTPIEVDRTSRQFIARVSHQVRQGYGIVPFVGSGLSARSGILMGQQFTDYLAHVFYKVVGDDDQRWKLREFGWPKIPNRGEVDTARDWIKEQLQYICRRSSLEPVYNDRGKLTGIVFGDEGAGAEGAMAKRA